MGFDDFDIYFVVQYLCCGIQKFQVKVYVDVEVGSEDDWDIFCCFGQQQFFVGVEVGGVDDYCLVCFVVLFDVFQGYGGMGEVDQDVEFFVDFVQVFGQWYVDLVEIGQFVGVCFYQGVIWMIYCCCQFGGIVGLLNGFDQVFVYVFGGVYYGYMLYKIILCGIWMWLLGCVYGFVYRLLKKCFMFLNQLLVLGECEVLFCNDLWNFLSSLCWCLFRFIGVFIIILYIRLLVLLLCIGVMFLLCRWNSLLVWVFFGIFSLIWLFRVGIFSLLFSVVLVKLIGILQYRCLLLCWKIGCLCILIIMYRLFVGLFMLLVLFLLVRWMWLLVLMLVGIFIDRVFCFFMCFWLWQELQGLEIILLVLWQCGQVCWIEKKFCCMCIWLILL